MVGNVPVRNLLNLEIGPYDLRSSFQILERTGVSNKKENFIEPFTTKNIQLLEEKDLAVKKDDEDSLLKQYHIFNSCSSKDVLSCTDDTDRMKYKSWKWSGKNGTAKPTNTFIYYTLSCANYAIITDFSLPLGRKNIRNSQEAPKWIKKSDFANKDYKIGGGGSKTNSIFRVPYKYSSSLLNRHMLIRNKLRNKNRI